MDQPAITRRDALKVGALGAAALALPLSGTLSAKSASELRNLPRPYTLLFRRPADLSPTGTLDVDGVQRQYFSIEQRPFDAHIIPGFTTEMWGYNGQFPGPTIRATRNVPIVVRQANLLPARHPTLGYLPATSTHLHGSPSRPQYDGYASDLTRPGQYKHYLYDNNEEERTNWYHDHAVMRTTENVYMGLAGLYVVRNPVDGNLPTGDFDVPLVITDAAFTRNGQLLFDDNGTSGINGDVILVNGVPWPVMPVQRRRYRFRILIASLGRGYRLQLSPQAPITVVATDGGAMPAAVEVATLPAAMAERYEVVVDFSAFPAGQRVELRNLGVENSIDYDHTNKVMAFQVMDTAPLREVATTMPPVAPAVPGEKPLMELTAADAVRRRAFRFRRHNGLWTIDQKTWADVERSGFQDVLADPKPGDVEIWEFQNNSGGWFHPIHTHLIDFKILDRNGRPPLPHERGPKDVVHQRENETVRIIARFGAALGVDGAGQPIRRTGRYMIHCHNTSHEDHDMMHQFRVGENTPANDPFSAPARDLPAP
jgi:FtsP/CotA-like multicopper oxidase with cupredoxin domain